MNVFYVYEHWRLDTDTCFYVGKGKGSRAYSRNRNQHWRRIVQKLESIGSAFEVKIVASGLTQEKAFSLEKERIAFWLTKTILANHTLGCEGWSGGKHSKEFKNKISQIHKDRIVSEETRKKLSKSLKGNPRLIASRKGFSHSEESKQKMRENFKGRAVSEEQRKKLRQAGLSKKITEEMRAILIAANTGRSLSEATKKKISDSQKGKVVSAEQRAKISASLKNKNAKNKQVKVEA